MKHIIVTEEADYTFACPFCGKELHMGNIRKDDCGHVLYAYEDVNGMSIAGEYDADELGDYVFRRGEGYLERFDEFFSDSYEAEDDEDEPSDLAWWNAWYHFELNVDELANILTDMGGEEAVRGLVIAETEPDVEGWGQTKALMVDRLPS